MHKKFYQNNIILRSIWWRSKELSPAQLSPPAGNATACCFHIASFGAVGGVVFTVFSVFLVLLPPKESYREP